MQDWRIGSFIIAVKDEPPKRMIGLVCDGLALDERRPNDDCPTWHMTHIASGLRLVMLRGAFCDIIGPADEIATCTDWGFASLPPPTAARDALIGVMERYPHIIVPGGGPAGTADDARRVQTEAVS